MTLAVSATYNATKHARTAHESMRLSMSWYMSSIRSMVATRSVAEMHVHLSIFQARVELDKLFGMCAKK